MVGSKTGGDWSEEGEGPISRWSRLKQESRRDSQEPPEAEPRLPQAQEAAETVRLEDLPDIDSLTYGSDFTVFLREGVPEELKRLALRKLWRSDPVLANLDGLNDYDLDYRALGADTRVTAALLAQRHMKDSLLRGEDPADAEDQSSTSTAQAGDTAGVKAGGKIAEPDAPEEETEKPESA